MGGAIGNRIKQLAGRRARRAGAFADIPAEWIRGARRKGITERRLDFIIAALRIIPACFGAYLLFLGMQPGSVRRRAGTDGAGKIQRADIVDRNGQELAVNLPTIDLYANTKNLVAPEESARALAKILPELKYEETIAKLKSGKGFAYLARNVAPAVRERVLLIGEPGFEFLETDHRFYP